MRCRFVRKIFCNKDNGYCVFVFHTMEEIPKEAKDPHYTGTGAEFTAKGDGLPDTDAVEADLQGWIMDQGEIRTPVPDRQLAGDPAPDKGRDTGLSVFRDDKRDRAADCGADCEPFRDKDF